VDLKIVVMRATVSALLSGIRYRSARCDGGHEATAESGFFTYSMQFTVRR
jgi:hypothetical protein